MAQLAKRSVGLLGIDETTRSVRVIASTRNPVPGFEIVDGVEVPRLEVLESWDLRRFTKYPVILWMHDGTEGPIGLADEVQETERGLEMRINFAAASVKADAEECWKQVKAGLLRGVSVGFTFGERTDQVVNGQTISTFRNNVLSEVSIVSVPADEDALIAEPEDDTRAREEGERPFAGYEDFDACILDQTGKGHSEESAKKICGKLQADHEKAQRDLSDAARKLGAARKPRVQKSDAADEVYRYDYVGRLGKVQRTQVGGIRVPARLTRIGVLNYRQADGSVRRELRTPEEVFNADSLATLDDAPVTDLDHHRGFIAAHTWKEAALGHTRNVRIDEKTYVAGELVINDAKTAADVENKHLVDISCGYSCRLDFTPGEWNGEQYDAIQRDIKYNHVAVLPPGKGRAGADVGIRLDSTDAVCVEEHDEGQQEMTLKIIKLDGRDIEYGSEQHIGYLETQNVALQKRYDADIAEAKKKADEAQARFDAAEKAAKKSADDAKAEAEKEAAAKEKAKRKHLGLVVRAMKYLEDEEEDDKEKKSDAVDALLDLSERELMARVIKADDKDFDQEKLVSELRSDGQSDTYINAFIESEYRRACKNLSKRTDGVDSVVEVVERAKRSDARAESGDPETKARLEMNKRNAERWQKPVGATK